MTEIDKVKNGELAIENDDLGKLRLLAKIFIPKVKCKLYGFFRFYWKHEIEDDWDCHHNTELPTIKASELWELINKENK